MEKETNVFARARDILQALKEIKDETGIIELELKEPGFSFYVRFPDPTVGVRKDVKIAEQVTSNEGVKQQAPEQSRSIRFDPWEWKRSKKFNNEED